MNAALNARIADVLSAFRAAGKPTTIAGAQDALGWRFLPVWEVEQLLARGALRRVANVVGVDCVDGRFEVADRTASGGDVVETIEGEARRAHRIAALPANFDRVGATLAWIAARGGAR